MQLRFSRGGLCVFFFVVLSAFSPLYSQQVDQPVLELDVGHSSFITKLCYSPDGTLLASVSYDGTAKLWDAFTGKLLRTFWAPLSLGCDLCFSPDGQTLYVAFADGIAGWDVRTGRRLSFPSSVGHFTIAVSPTGLIASGAGIVSLWWQGKNIAELNDLSGAMVNCLCFTHDGRYLIGCNRSGDIAIWAMDTHVLLRKWRAATNRLNSVFNGGISISLDDKFLVCSGDDYQSVNLWSIPDGKLLKTMTIGCSGNKGVFAFDSTGTALLAVDNDNVIRVFDIRTGELRGTPLKSQALSLAFSKDGTQLAAGGAFGEITVWNFAERKLKRVLRSFSSSIAVIAVSTDDQWLVWGGNSIRAIAWDLKQSLLRNIFPGDAGSLSSALSPKNSPFIFLSSAQRYLIKWSPTTASFVQEDYHDAELKSCVDCRTGLSPDGSLMAIGGPGENDSGKSYHTILLIETGNHSVYRKLKGHETGKDASGEYVNVISNLVFSADGLLLASSSLDGTVRIWDVSKGECLREIKAAPYGPVAFSPDSQILVVDGPGWGEIGLWSVRNGNLLGSLNGHSSWVRWLAFSPDGRWLASTGADATLIIWNVKTGEKLQTLTSYQGSGIGVNAWFADSRRLISGGANGIATIWDTMTGKALASLMIVPPPPDAPEVTQPEWLIVTPEGYFNSSLNGAKIVRWRIGDQLYPLEQFAERFKKPEVVAKAIRGESITELPVLTVKRTPPRVIMEILKQSGSEADTVRVRLTAVPGSSEAFIRRIELRANGRLLDLDHAKGITVASKGISLAAKRVEVVGKEHLVQKLASDDKEASLIVNATIPLSPDEPGFHLVATAYDDQDLKSESGMIMVRSPRATVRESTGTSDLYLLAVGVSQYANREYLLHFADVDAKELAECLKEQEGKAFNKVYIKLITNEQATNGTMREALKWLQENPKRSDIALVLFSGHGVRGGGGKLYFFTHNGDLDALRDTCVGWNEVDQALAQCRARQVLMLMDCCHAGAFGERRASAEELAERLVRKSGVLVFSSCRGYEQSFESDEWKHGAFTKAILEGLKGAADPFQQGGITVTGLLDYISATIPKMTQDRQHPWVPSAEQFDTQLKLAKIK